MTRVVVLVAATASLLSSWIVSTSSFAQVLGSYDLDLIFIADRQSSGNDTIDIFRTSDYATFGNALQFAGSTNQIEAITDSNTPGVAYAITAGGDLYRVDYNSGTTSLIANLGSDPGVTGDDDQFFNSITNRPGDDRLFILRTESAHGGGNTDEIDTYDLKTGIYVTKVLETVNGGTIDISDGPPTAFSTVDTGSESAIYTIASGGAFEVFDPSVPSGTGTAAIDRVAISTGAISNNNLAGDDGFESLTNVADLGNQMAILEDTNGSGAGTNDNVFLFDTDSVGRSGTVGTTFGTGGIAITDVGPGNPDAVVAVATGGAISVIDDVDGTPAFSFDESAGLSGTQHRDVTNAPASPYGFIYIADDGTANEIDTFNALGLGTSAPANDFFKGSGVLSDAATTTSDNGASDDYADVSLTDGLLGGSPFLFELHTDGQLFQIDAVTGLGKDAPLVDLNPTVATNRDVFDSITNIPGTTLLAILRTDRNLDSKTVGSPGLTEVIDLFDFVSGDYQEAVYTTFGTGGIAISDGPSYQDENGAFSDGYALYVIATGGSFEVFDPFDLTFSNREQISIGTPGGGNYVDITNLPGDPDGLYALWDHPTSGSDRIYRMPINGDNESLLSVAAGSAGSAITDTNDGGLFAIAEGGTVSYVTRNGVLTNLGTYNLLGNFGSLSSVTNIAPVPEPSSALGLLITLTVAVIGYRRRKVLST